MKKLFTHSIFSALLTLSLPLKAAETLILDPQHSYVLWKVNHLGFSTQSGKWYVKGQVNLDKDHPDKSKVEATINIADMITGIPKLDEHLKGDAFFNVTQYPIAKFVSSKVDVTGKNTAKVQGLLTLHGVSKPLTLEVTLNKVGENPISHQMVAGFSAKTTLKRSNFAMKAFIPEISDQVTIEIGAEAYQPKGNDDATKK